MKPFISVFLIFIFAFFVCYDGNSQNRAVSTIEWKQDGTGFIQYSTNNPEHYETAWWQLTDNILGNIYQIECKKINGSANMGYGLVFGASNTDSQKLYTLLINMNGYYYVGKEDGKKQTTIKDWTLSEKLNTGYNATNILKVIKNGTAFTVFLNGSQVYQFKDSSIKGDRLGYLVSVGDQNQEQFPARPVDVRFKHAVNIGILGDRYNEQKGGFSMLLPKDWKLMNAKQKYLMAIGQAENNFSPNVGFIDERYTGSVQQYMVALVAQLQQSFEDAKVTDSGSFETLQGIQGNFVTMQGKNEVVNFQQRYYILPNLKGNMIMAIFFSISGDSVINSYNAVFDECVKTFVWTK